MTKGKKIDDLARVEYRGMSDGITGVAHFEFTLLSTGEVFHWMPGNFDWEYTRNAICDLRTGDEVALEAFAYDDMLRRVRFCKANGEQFRGLAWHRKHRAFKR